MRTAYESSCQELFMAVTNWNNLMNTDLANLNGELAKAKLSPVSAQTLPTVTCK